MILLLAVEQLFLDQVYDVFFIDQELRLFSYAGVLRVGELLFALGLWIDVRSLNFGGLELVVGVVGARAQSIGFCFSELELFLASTNYGHVDVL